MPTEIRGNEKIYVPTQDYFQLKFLADPPYRPENGFTYDREFQITGLQIRGDMEEDRVRFQASLHLFINHQEWSLVGLPFQNVFIEEILLDGRSIPVRAEPGHERDIYEIPVTGQGYHSIDLTFYTEIASQLGRKTLFLGLPESFCSEMTLYLPQKDMVLEFSEPDSGYYIEESNNGLVVKASLSGKSAVNVSWFPRKYMKKTEKPLIYADCAVDMFMGYEETLLAQEIKIRIEKSSLAALSFLKPEHLFITDVFSDKVKSWQITKRDGREILDVTFKNELTDSADILIKGKFHADPDAALPSLFLEPLDAKRIHGTLDLYGMEDERLEVEDLKNLRPRAIKEAQSISGFSLKKSYSFLSQDFSAHIVKIPEETRVFADILSTYTISENLMSSSHAVSLNVKKGLLSSVRIKLPEGVSVHSVEAEDVSDHVIRDNVLILPLNHAIKGRYAFHLLLEKELPYFDSLSMKSIELLNMDRISGSLFIVFPRGFDVQESLSYGLKSSSIDSGVFRSHFPAISKTAARYAYTFSEEPFQAKYIISRKEPVLDTVNVYHANVKDNLVHVDILSLFHIKDAPMDQFSIIVPQELKDSITITGDGIKTILKKDMNDGEKVLIDVRTLSRLDSSYILLMSFNAYFESNKTFEMPRITFPQAKHRTDFLSVEAATVYHVEPKVIQNLQETEPDAIPALPSGVSLGSILWSYVATDSSDWKYGLELKRLEREKLVKAKILREDIKTLIIPNGFALHAINIKTNNRTLQFLPADLPQEAEIWSLKVAGDPVRPVFDEPAGNNKRKSFFIPLIKSGTGDRSFDIALIYITPIREMGLFGRIDLGMIETGEIPVEKTTWTLFAPENYGYFHFKSNMEKIDPTTIEAEKTLDLAKEYKYWTNLAQTVSGELREKALLNTELVMKDYSRQQALTQQMQYDLDYRAGDKRYDQSLIQNAKEQNLSMLDEASQIVESQKPLSKSLEQKKAPEDKSAIFGRRKIKGWQFKTGGFDGQEDIEESVKNYIQNEDLKLKAQQEKMAEKKRQEVVQKEKYKWAESKEIPVESALEPGKKDASEGLGDVLFTERKREEKLSAPPEPQIQQEPLLLPEKKSVLLKGMRSVDIVFPEKGIKLSFKKLGGNPTLFFNYRKKGSASRIFLLLLCLSTTFGAFRIRKLHFSPEKIESIFKGKRISDYIYYLLQSKTFKTITIISLVPTLLISSPLFLLALGLTSIFLIRRISLKRYTKIGYVPPFNIIVFIKYLPSYIIVCCIFFSLFNIWFLLPLFLTTLFNFVLAVIYGIITFFTKETVYKQSEIKKE
ncbi:MAG: hypothetical protein JW928_02475 [Candidatus Aureabacteria bacterium]|nr:hypothetical protein [Candidatus Auribacterota bacterium]